MKNKRKETAVAEELSQLRGDVHINEHDGELDVTVEVELRAVRRMSLRWCTRCDRMKPAPDPACPPGRSRSCLPIGSGQRRAGSAAGCRGSTPPGPTRDEDRGVPSIGDPEKVVYEVEIEGEGYVGVVFGDG